MELWTNLPGWIRYPVALGFIAAGVFDFFYSNPIRLYRAGTLIGIGCALCLIGPSDSEKKGYKF